jgi:hypothetical protein
MAVERQQSVVSSLWVVLVPYAVTRLALLIVGMLAVRFGEMLSGGWHASPHAWIDIWARWDSAFYFEIASAGYSYTSGQMSSVAFYPVYPLLLRGLTLGATDWQALTVVGWLVSNVATLLAWLLLYRLVRLDWPEPIARRTIWCLACFPTSFFLSVVYTEGLFLFLTVAAFYAARRGWWLAAGLLGAVSAATRSIGVFLLFPLLMEWIQTKPRHLANAVPLLLVPLGLGAFMFYLQRTFGDPLLFTKAVAVWGRVSSLEGLDARIRDVRAAPDVMARLAPVLVELGFAGLGIILFFGLLRRQRPSYQLYSLYALGMPLLTLQPSSIPRYMVVIFPLFIVLAQWLRRPWVMVLVLALFGLFQALLFARWSLWYWVA